MRNRPDQEAMFIFVNGAPGSGKSTLCSGLSGRLQNCVCLDIDSILNSASALAGRDIRKASETWPAYDALWLDVLLAVEKNGVVPVLFTPWTRDVLQPQLSGVQWLLLDCSDLKRKERLSSRGWSLAEIEEALEDASSLREESTQVIDTGSSVDVSLSLVEDWVRATLR